MLIPEDCNICLCLVQQGLKLKIFLVHKVVKSVTNSKSTFLESRKRKKPDKRRSTFPGFIISIKIDSQLIIIFIIIIIIIIIMIIMVINLVGIVQLFPRLAVHLLVLVHPLVDFLEQPGHGAEPVAVTTDINRRVGRRES